MPFNISKRLEAIAGCIGKGERVADIGSDHGLLPLFLTLTGRCDTVIISDINTGPLEKARRNIARHAPHLTFDIRQGNGLTTLKPAEADTIVIAGMGGGLIIDILSRDLALTRSFGKLILQPRRDAPKLRCWLLSNGFRIVDELLAPEKGAISEIIVATASGNDAVESSCSDLDLEFSPLLFHKRDPLLRTFIQQKKTVDEKNIRQIRCAMLQPEQKKAASGKRLAELERRVRALERLLLDL